MQHQRSPQLQGIEVRHQKACRTRADKDARCNCDPSYRPYAYDARTRRPLRGEWVSSLAQARSARVTMLNALATGTIGEPSTVTLREAASDLIEGMKTGQVRNRSGRLYKPSVIRSYESALRLYILSDLGAAKITAIRRKDVQALADRLALELDPSTVRNGLMPLRVIFRRAVNRDIVTVNPTIGLELPAVEGRRAPQITPAQAEALLAVLPVADRPLWATAFYAGLRMGEIRALDWKAVDFERNIIRVQASWDPVEGLIEPKSKAGRRVVPIPAILLAYLKAHQQTRRTGLVFGRAETVPFAPDSVTKRADRIWKAEKLDRITPHECRHVYASLMIHAGVNAKALSTFMGHSSIQVTFDLYGHLMPGSEAEAADLLNVYLDRPLAAVGA
jgi:integrase